MKKEFKWADDSSESDGVDLSRVGAALQRFDRLHPTKQLSGLESIAGGLSRRIAESSGLNALAQDVSRWANDYVREQLQGVFASIDSLADRIYPENMRESKPTLDQLEQLLLEEGIPLMWVPGPKVVRALLDAPDAATRRDIIGERWQEIVGDCEAVASTVDHPDLLEARDFAIDCVAALRAGHAKPAQALAANLLDSLMSAHFKDDLKGKLTSHKKTPKFDLNGYGMRIAFTFAPVWRAHATFKASDRDTIPSFFVRHASVHGVSRVQYSRINAIYALMLATSVMRFLDIELER
ncbi:hypothetical protein [Streptomyces sp. SM11]|uniref:hypothetical protein n=1 Tax=Streptomyces sp. SM11 TaxID=565557 RepID=UPI000CD4AE91|nr:hypothetical protein [Streptomyces sp. SM11]